MKKHNPPAEEKRSIDWPTIRRRIDNVRVTLERGLAPSAEEKKNVLKARATTLARELRHQETAAESLEVVEFLLANETYGIESSFVREVFPVKDLTPLPCTPRYVYGIVNVRGQMMSVVDIKKFFDLPERGLTDLNKLVIIRKGAMEFGILADAMIGVRAVALNDIQPSLPTLTGIRSEYLKAVTSDRLIVLDAEKVLTDVRLVVHEDVE